MRVHQRREQQRVQHRLLKAQPDTPRRCLQKLHVERRVVRHQHRVLRKQVEGRQHRVDARLAGHHLGPDAVDANARRRNGAAGIDQLLERFLPQQPTVDHTRRAELDDLVAARGVQARGLGVEHGVDQLAQASIIQCARRLGVVEQVEVEELGPALERRVALGRGFNAAGQRQQKAEAGLVRGTVPLEPHLGVVPLDHIAHRQCLRLAADAHRVQLPAHGRLGAHGMAGPDEIEARALVVPRQPQSQPAHAERFHQPLAQVHEGL